MWSVMVIILLPLCNACLSNHNQKVCFHSRNFHNILHWDPVDPTLFPGEKVTYSVQYKHYGELQFQIKESCQNITALSCDLSEDTPSDHDIHYLARVLANGVPHGTTNRRFTPLKDTILGPPILATYTTVSSLHVDVTLPFGPKGVPIAEIIEKSKILPYSTVIQYTLTITHPAWAAQQVRESTTGQFNIGLKNKTEYCGYVVYKPSSELGRPQSENASFCDTLKDEPLRPLPWLLTSAALLLVIVIMAGLCACNYVKGGKDKSMPPQLVTAFTTPPRILQSPDGNLVISKPEMCTKTDQTVYAKIQMKPNVPSVGVGGYSPQDILGQPWQDSSGSSVGTGAHSPAPNAVGSSAQSSEYGMVAVHVPAGVNNFQEFTTEDRESSNPQASSTRESWDKGGPSPKMTSHRVPPLPAPDSCDNSQATLLVHTVRGPSGQLMFDLLKFQTQSSTGDTERKPLLSDFKDSKQEGPTLASLTIFDGSECSDSGCDDSSVNTPIQQYCNTHYFPSQPVVTDLPSGCQNKSSPSDTSFESGYKQNWMPAILHEYRTNYPWNWTGDKKDDEEEEEEDRGGEEESRRIILGNWMVQLQD